MRVFVTGVSGQLGSALLKTAPNNFTVSGLTRDQLDLGDADAIAQFIAAEKPDWVINAAAYTAVDKAEDNAQLAAAINAAAPRAFARGLSRSGGRLVQISTDFVFNGTSQTPYLPNDARSPLSVYGQTKADGEDAASENAASENAIIVRTSWVYAAGGTNFVRTMLRLMRERDEISVVSDQMGAPTWARGLAQTIWALIAKGNAGIYHHRDAGETSWHGFATAIAEEALELGLIEKIPIIHAIPTSDYPTPAARPPYSVLDDGATRVLLGDLAQNWRDNLRTMLKEEKALG